jgi:hypothetical protein
LARRLYELNKPEISKERFREILAIITADACIEDEDLPNFHMSKQKEF